MDLLWRCLVLLLITIVFQIICSILFHFGAKQISEGHSESDADQLFLFIKWCSFALCFFLFGIILLWDFIGFAYYEWYHKLTLILFVIYLAGYRKSCLNMLDHLVCLLYSPYAAGEFQYETIWGEFVVENGKPMMIQDVALLSIDLSKRLK